MNERTCFWFIGGVIFTMTSTFSSTGWIPVRVTQNFGYFISVCPKNDFSILHLSLFDIIFVSTSSNLSKWSDKSPSAIIKISLMYALINYIPRNISFIISWKTYRDLHTPIGRHLYLYVTHKRIILHKLLASLLRRKL